jgi:U5 small nuclear ribonucleoprotein component
MEVPRLTAGMWVLIEGVSDSITKTATIVGEDVEEDMFIFRPIAYNNKV